MEKSYTRPCCGGQVKLFSKEGLMREVTSVSLGLRVPFVIPKGYPMRVGSGVQMSS